MTTKVGPRHAIALASCLAFAAPAFSTNIEIDGLTLSKIRAVGDYQGTTYDNTVELWFAAPLVWPTGSPCNITYRVEVDASNKHLVAAAYLAIATGRKVNINVDDALPIRNGTCQVSYLDVSA